MTDHNAPNNPGQFTITTFIAFVVVFVFVMLMMLWHGDTNRDNEGNMHYQTQVNEPSDGNTP